MSETSSSTDDVWMSFEALHALCTRVLEQLGLSAAQAQSVAQIIAAGQRDACGSHGVYRLLSCAHTIRNMQGRIRLNAEPVVQATSGPIVRVDAQYGFSPLAFDRGLPHLVQAARQHGLAALVINHCFHFSALWPEIEAITAHGLAAMAMTPSHAWVAPAGGHRPLLGTNPIAFGWPRAEHPPYVFDFATSAIARGDLELHRRAGPPCPKTVAWMHKASPAQIRLLSHKGPCWPLVGTKVQCCLPWWN